MCRALPQDTPQIMIFLILRTPFGSLLFQVCCFGMRVNELLLSHTPREEKGENLFSYEVTIGENLPLICLTKPHTLETNPNA